MISYEQIEQANGKLTTIQLGTGGKKKDYVMVPQRVKAFRMLYPEGFITTEILSHENNIVVMQARAGYYNEKGEQIVLGTGLAFEERNKGMVNGTSYIENCETSAVGRALGFLALGVDGGGICSAEELVNALTAQEQKKAEDNAKNAPARPAQTQNGARNVTVTTGATVPQPAPAKGQNGPQNAPVAPAQPETAGAYLKRRIAEMKATYPGFDFQAARKSLIESGTVPDVPSATMKMEQAVQLMDAVRDIYEGLKEAG